MPEEIVEHLETTVCNCGGDYLTRPLDESYFCPHAVKIARDDCVDDESDDHV